MIKKVILVIIEWKQNFVGYLEKMKTKKELKARITGEK